MNIGDRVILKGTVKSINQKSNGTEVVVKLYDNEYINVWEAACKVDEQVVEQTVDHPKHYNRTGAMECIDEMILAFGKEAVKNFCICNAWKYRYRSSDKNGQEDIEKSDWYMKKAKELGASIC